jgi:hypothetical protein
MLGEPPREQLSRDDDGAVQQHRGRARRPRGRRPTSACDLGLVNDPTVVTLWSNRQDSKKRNRFSLRRMYHLWRFREKQIRQFQYVLGWKVGKRLRGAGYDVTGLGLPIFQGIEDDEVAPQHLIEVSQGYVFNAKVPVGVDPSLLDRGQRRARCATSTATS